jgi:NAD(P)H-flavin reductase
VSNPFQPNLATLAEVKDLTGDIKLFRAVIKDEGVRKSFGQRPGQFAFVSRFGVGEAPFCLASASSRGEYIDFAIKRVGLVTDALHDLEAGATIGIRGPLGNYFPMDAYKGKDLVIIGGGIGLAPLRPVIQTVIDHRADYGKLTVIYGARTPNDLVFTDEYEEWASAPNAEFHVTVDVGDESWKGNVGHVPGLVGKIKPSPRNSVTLTCGPPIMIKFALKELHTLEFKPEQIVTTLESKMKCGVGKCGRCNVGEKYVCLDGPVFDYAQIGKFLEEF